MRQLTLKAALTLAFLALGGPPTVLAQVTPAAPPGPATQPPPPPGTAQPAPTQPAAAAPAAPAAPPNYKLQYNGLIDGYYLFNFHNPKNVSAGAGEPYYDTRHNSPTLTLAELNVFQNAAPGKFGYKATLMIGDTADIGHFDYQGASHGLGEARFKAEQQIYATYAFNAAGAGVDFGKFYTPFGYEVVESNGDYNYSRSTAYDILPTYHAGARIYSPVPGLVALTATFYLVNGLYNTPTMGVQNDSKRPGYIGQLNYTDPKGKFILISELGLGSQKFTEADKTETKVVLNDNNFTYNLNANQIVGLDYEYARNSVSGSKVTINGYAVYYRQALTSKTAFALRFSGYDQKVDDGIGSVAHARPYDITATYEIKTAPNFLTRFEYRHDHINYNNGTNLAVASGFAGGNSVFDRNDQDTVSLSGVFTFGQ